MLDFVPFVSPCIALDAGCGTGFPTLELAERLGEGSHVHGIDTSEVFLERARFKARTRGVRNVTFEQGDASALIFEDDFFDLIVSNLGLNNFTDRDAVIRECRRVLKPGAILALTTNLYGHMSEVYTAFRETLSALNDAAALERLEAQERSRSTAQEGKQQLAACGFTVLKLERRMLKMRFANAGAFLGHSFTKQAFLDAWKDAVEPPRQAATFAALEERLDRLAVRDGLGLTVPMAYFEAT
ncbi:MAG: class I SAM-dependent methyltransferase [Candidatus Eremiobacteraeota bacterium]|nr:class I SAM-dependent methyltransferase [Candidatus Eremiobacteraeota bacterium]